MKHYKNRYILSMMLLTVFATALLSGCNSKEVEKQEVKNVKTIRAASSSISLNVEYAGEVKPLEEVSITSKIPGTVLSIKADVGSEVKKGQELFILDPETAAAQLQQSKAALSNANANLTRITDSSASQQILQLETALKQAQIQYDDAKRTYEDTKALLAADAVSQQQLDDAESYYKNAEIQYNNANESLKLLKEKATPQNTAIAAAQLDEAQAAYTLAAIQVNDTTVKAPVSGIVSIRNISVGELSTGTIPAFTIINIDTILIEIEIPDNIVSKVQKGQKISVKFDTLDDKTFEGIVDTISPAADSRSQFYRVKLKIDNADHAIRPGMFARVILPMESKANVLTVPNEALVAEDGIQNVYTVVENKIKKVPVSIGLSNDKLTEVKSGLKAGDIVITEGQSFLNEGETVFAK